MRLKVDARITYGQLWHGGVGEDLYVVPMNWGDLVKDANLVFVNMRAIHLARRRKLLRKAIRAAWPMVLREARIYKLIRDYEINQRSHPCPLPKPRPSHTPKSA